MFQEIAKPQFCCTCARFGYFELVKWGHFQNGSILNVISGTISSKTPEAGALPFMKWARSEGAKFFLGDCKIAAERGFMETVKWMVEEGEWRDNDLWRQELVVGAAAGNHMDILLWAKEKGFLSLDYPTEYYAPLNLLNAGFIGGPEILKFLIAENSVSLHGLKNMDGFFLNDSATKHLSSPESHSDRDSIFRKRIFGSVKYLRECGVGWGGITCKFVAENADFETLRWVWEHGCPHYGTYTSYLAAFLGDFEMLKWLREQGSGWDEDTCAGAARSGNFELLKWLRDNECPWNELTCTSAADTGNIEILTWARENGCPWDVETCATAAGRNFEILQWARDHGCPWDQYACLCAARSGNLEILKWLHEHDCPWDEATCNGAMQENQIETLDWAFTNGCPCKPSQIWKCALESGKLDALNWAKKNLPPLNRKYILSLDTDNWSTLTWMQKNGMLSLDDPPPGPEFFSHSTIVIRMLKEKIPSEFAKREIEVLWEVGPHHRLRWELAPKAHDVLSGAMSVTDFCEEVLDRLGGR
jgi:hypothetical protein